MDHLLQVENATGQKLVPEINIPMIGEHLWQYFWQLHQGRGSTGFGPAPLSYLEMDAWMRLCMIELYWWEVEIIKHMDNAYLKASGESSQKKKSKEVKKK